MTIRTAALAILALCAAPLILQSWRLPTRHHQALVAKTYGTLCDTVPLIVSDNNFIGVNIDTPQYRLDVNGFPQGNPLRLKGLLPGNTTDSLVSSQNGVLKRIAPMSGVMDSLSSLKNSLNSGLLQSRNYADSVANAVKFKGVAYMSEAGNDTTAVFGSPSKPYKTFKAVRNAFALLKKNGQLQKALVRISRGNYELGIDKNGYWNKLPYAIDSVAGKSPNSTSIVVNGLNYHFEAGAKLVYDFNARPIYVDNYDTCSIFVDGTERFIECVNVKGTINGNEAGFSCNTYGIFNLVAPNATYVNSQGWTGSYLPASGIFDLGNWYVGYKEGITTSRLRAAAGITSPIRDNFKFYLKEYANRVDTLGIVPNMVRSYTTPNQGVTWAVLGWYAAKGDYTVRIDNIKTLFNSAFMFRGFKPESYHADFYIDSSNFDFKIGNYYERVRSESPAQSNTIISIFNRIRHCKIAFKLENADINGNVMNTQVWDNLILTNTQLVVDIENLSKKTNISSSATRIPMFNIVGSADDSSVIIIRGNYVSDSTTIINVNGNFRIVLDGTFKLTKEGVPVINIAGGSPKIILSSRARIITANGAASISGTGSVIVQNGASTNVAPASTITQIGGVLTVNTAIDY